MKYVKWIALATLVTVVVAAAVGYAAYQQGRKTGMAEGVQARTNFLQERTGGGAPGAAAAAGNTGRTPAGAANAAGTFTTGQVKSVNGNDVEISTATEVVKIKLTDKTQIQKTVSGASSDLQPGERVVIQGVKAADGTFEARSIQLGGARMGGPGQGGQ